MIGIHLTLTPDKLSEVVQLRKEGKITSPEGVKIIEEYVWDLTFLVILVEAEKVRNVLVFVQEFAEHATDIEVGVVTKLRDLTR